MAQALTLLAIPAFYTIIPGAHFRERAAGTSVGMFVAKLTIEQFPTDQAIARLLDMDRMLPGKYFVQFYLGNIHLELSDPEKALTHFSRSLDLTPTEQDIPASTHTWASATRSWEIIRQP